MLARGCLTAVAAALIAIGATGGAVNAAELVKFDIKDEAISTPLTSKAGDPVNGRKVSLNRRKGNCLACHVISDAKDEQFHGEIGPPLDGVSERYSEGEIRLRIVNPKVINPDTFMPAFYRNDGFHRVLKRFQGKTILSAQEVEDVIAYLKTLK